MENIIDFITTFDSVEALLASFAEVYGLVAIFLSVFFLGETAILIALIMSQQETLHFSDVFLYSVIGTICADIFWFTVGRYFPERVIPVKVRGVISHSAQKIVEPIIRDRLFLSLVLLKFIIGLRLAIILYLGRYPITWARFLYYDMIGTVLYMVVLSGIGVAFGNMISALLPKFHFLSSLISGVIIFLLLSHITRYLYGVILKKSQ